MEAASPIADVVRGVLPSVSGDLAGTVRVTGGRTGAAVREGRAKVPYAGWIDFGGTRKRPHPATRPFIKVGRYLYPSAGPLAADAARTYAAALERGFASFPWSNTGSVGASVHD
jgi:hypothetical protein